MPTPLAPSIQFAPFITGSRAYGTPTEKSDVDLVVLLTSRVSNALWQFSNTDEILKFGKLNVIGVYSKDEWRAWKTATDRMVKIKKETGATFNREVATLIIDEEYDNLGLPQRRGVSE